MAGRKGSKSPLKLGETWLGRRGDSGAWYRYWWDAERGCTRRASLGTEDLEEAKQLLREWYAREHHPENARIEDVPLATIIRLYYEEHAMNIPSHEAARIALNLWLDHFGEKSVAEATKPKAIDGFIAWLKKTGRSANYINRVLSSGRAAINMAYKKGIIQGAPFIRQEKVGLVPPKGRPLSIEELRALYHLADKDYLKRFILWMIGTAGRPDAICELHLSQIDLEHGLVHLNPPGREQTKKYRPSVKLPPTLRNEMGEGPWLIMYKKKRVKEVKAAWRRVRAAAGLDAAVQPYSLRHTVARYLRASGVPAWEVSAQLGHKQHGFSITEIYAPFDPSYLSASSIALEKLLAEIIVPTDIRPLTLPERCQSGDDAQGADGAKSLKGMVGGTRFELVTPTMST